MTRIVPATRPTIFLTAQDVPPNLLRLRHGDVVTLTRSRFVSRVGYRLHAHELYTEAEQLLDTEAGQLFRKGLVDLVAGMGPRAAHSYAHTTRELLPVVARALVRSRGFGGPERGVRMWSSLDNADYWQVESTRCARLGRYFSACGSKDDYESGGLTRTRTVVLARVTCNGISREVLSGDLALACPARCAGRLVEGAYVHAERCRRTPLEPA